jgi:hypothetical protein
VDDAGAAVVAGAVVLGGVVVLAAPLGAAVDPGAAAEAPGAAVEAGVPELVARSAWPGAEDDASWATAAGRGAVAASAAQQTPTVTRRRRIGATG